MKALAAFLAYLLLLAAFWVVAGQFGVRDRLGGYVVSSFAGFALLLAPYWAFGFGWGEWLRTRLHPRWIQVIGILALTLPYVVFTVPRGAFQWNFFLGF